MDNTQKDTRMKQETFDATLAAAGSKTAYTGAGVSGAGFFLSSEFFGLTGVLIGVIGLLVNLVFKLREDRRRQREHDARMQALVSE